MDCTRQPALCLRHPVGQGAHDGGAPRGAVASLEADGSRAVMDEDERLSAAVLTYVGYDGR